MGVRLKMCNPWCNEFVTYCSNFWKPEARLLEVGSLNVNGSPRDVLQDHKGEYIGVDLTAGLGVDMILDVKNLTDVFGPRSFDAVISTGSLEHMDDWRVAVWQMCNVLKIGGVLCLTTCSPGFEYHPYPLDKWRFTVEQFQAIFTPPMTIESIMTSPHTRLYKGKNVYAEIAICAIMMETSTDAIMKDWWNHLQKVEASNR